MNLDQIAESIRYDTKNLSAVRDKVSAVIARGEMLIAEFSDIGLENMTSVKAGIDRLKNCK